LHFEVDKQIKMKKLIVQVIALFLSPCLFAQNVGIGTTSPHASAQLEVSSTTKGMLAPRMTTAQRNAIASPAKGLLVYDTDLNALYHHNGSGWAAVGNGGGGFSLPFEGSVNIANPGFKITNAGQGAAIHANTTNEFGSALLATNTTNFGYSMYAYSRSPNAIGLYAYVDSSTAIKGQSANGIGVDAQSQDSTAIRARILKGANADPVILATHSGVGIAVDASSNTGVAIKGVSNAASGGAGAVWGINNNANGGNGVYGSALSAAGAGVRGESNLGTGVLAYSGSNIGVSAGSLSGTALYGNSTSGYALHTSGKVKIAGGNTNPAAGAVLTSVDASGNAVWKVPPQVAFRATGVYQGLNVIPNFSTRKMHFPSEQYDYANSFTTTTSASPTTDMSNFVAPVSGLYHFEFALSMQLADLSDDFESLTASIIIKRGANTFQAARSDIPCCDPKGFAVNILVSSDLKLIIGDDVFVEIRQSNDGDAGATIANTSFDTYFCGRLIYAD
jgi:hypothetical protein